MAAVPIEELAEALRRDHPELEAVRAAAEGTPVYLVGGAVRDLILGRPRGDLDLVVVGDAPSLAAKLGAHGVEHQRFATAKVWFGNHAVDFATARVERYPRPGALPEVEPATDIETDLLRRDFTVNAMAMPLSGERLIDPHGGRADLDAGLLRVLHARSFLDDPTRALRAARYAARFGFRLESETEALLRGTDLATVSEDRLKAELLRLAGEESAAAGFALLGEWELLSPRPDAELVARVAELVGRPPWRYLVEPDRAVLRAAIGPVGGWELAAKQPERPSEAVELARSHDWETLTMARARGAEWLDDYLRWRAVQLEIDGDDLIAAGVPEGPSIGAALAATLRRKLDGEVDGRDEELRAALAFVRESGG